MSFDESLEDVELNEGDALAFARKEGDQSSNESTLQTEDSLRKLPVKPEDLQEGDPYHCPRWGTGHGGK